MSEQFAEQFISFVDSGDVDQVLRCLDGLKTRLSIDTNATNRHARYWLAIDSLRCLGPLELSRDQLLRLRGFFQYLVESAIPASVVGKGWQEKLPEYVGLENCSGVNVFHVLALSTSTDPVKAEAFFSTLKRAGYVSETLLRGKCYPGESLPIHLACEVGNEQVVLDILRYDRDQIGIRDEKGLTVSQIAESFGHKDLAGKLREKTSGIVRPIAAPAVSAPEKRQKVVGTDMLDMLQGFHNQHHQSVTSPIPRSVGMALAGPHAIASVSAVEPVAPTQRSEDRVVEIQAGLSRLKKLIITVCEQIPGGLLMADFYYFFLVRSGITNVSDLKSEANWERLKDRFPTWMRTKLERST
jgi:hypothetical protein